MNIFEENTIGQFGEFGGKFIPETLSFAIEELENEYSKISKSESFQNEFKNLLKEFVGRPTPYILQKIYLSIMAVQKYILNVKI